MNGLTGFLFGRKRAIGYPGKGLFGKPAPRRRAVVKRELCRGCRDCTSVCHYGKIRVDRKGTAKVRRGCSGCAACMSVCPSGAIVMIDND